MATKKKATPVKNENAWIEEVGAPQYQSIADMVAALECDFDRLDELRGERTDWIDNDGGDEDEQDRTAADWSREFPAESAELDELEKAAGDHSNRDDAQNAIMEDALDIRVFGERVNGEWQADRVEILLCTGGPAARIMAELDEHGEPCRAWLEVQDWFKPWTQYYPGSGSGDVLLTYAQQFGGFAE